MTRANIFDIIQQDQNHKTLRTIYNVVMLVAIAASIVPLMFKGHCPLFRWIELATVSIFIVDYLQRWLTADFKLQSGRWAFVRYPFTAMAIVDLLTICPV